MPSTDPPTTPAPPPPRTCGSCGVCCQAPAIVGLAKPSGKRCELLVGGVHGTTGGCTAWQHRTAPEFHECRTFRCLWLDGWFQEQDRPDHLGVMFVSRPDPDRPGDIRVQAAESFLGAAGKGRAAEIVAEILRLGKTVAVTNWQFVLAVLPTGDSWRYAIDPLDPLHGRVDPAAAPVRLTIAGKRVVNTENALRNAQKNAGPAVTP